MKQIFSLRYFAAAVILGILLGVPVESSTAFAEILEVNEENFPDDALRSYLTEQSNRTQISADGYGGVLKTYFVDTDQIISLELDNVSEVPDLSKLPKVTSVTFEKYTGNTIDFKNSSVKHAYINQAAAAGTLKIMGKKLKELHVCVTDATEKMECSLPNVSYVEITGNDKITEISGLNKSKKLTGLALWHFPNINSKSLPLETLTKLKTLSLSECGLSSLNTGKLEKLTVLDISGNQLTSLDVSKLKNLSYLKVSENRIKSLDVRNNRKLTGLYVDGNKKLKKLDVSNNKKLTGIDVGSTGLSKLNLENNKELSLIRCNDTKISTLNLNKKKHLDTIMYSGSRIKKLNLKKYRNLTIEYKAKPGSTISFADFVGTGYTVLNKESDLFSYNSKKGSITVKNKKYETRWNNITLKKGKKLLRIHIYIKE